MCTAITLQSMRGENFFGRTMDYSHDILPHMFTVPSGYVWNTLENQRMRDSYSFIGIGQQLNGLLAFFDGVNENGFAAAALYFAGYAMYSDIERSSPNTEKVATFDFLHYILGRCSSIEDLYTVVNGVSIIGNEDPVTNTVAPLHWIATDKSGACVVMEMTDNGFVMFQNEIGVMANSPDFQWHMTNLRNYSQVSPEQTKEAMWGDICLKPFGQGAGTALLPGGYTSPARFVRTAYLKTHIPLPETKIQAITSCFNIMKSVTIPKGAVVSERNTDDYTKYTAFIDTDTCEYYFNTYENQQITKAILCKLPQSNHQLFDMGSIYLPVMIKSINAC
jgi:Penicillin V acylase and related amidases